ncbi:MAG: hypothetical protein QNK20_14930 [Aureibaculum sp.]|nr:hypothetical protein [Aureibaculum sp.]
MGILLYSVLITGHFTARSIDDERAVIMDVLLARTAGATREEVKTTVLLGLSVIGLKAASKYLPIVLLCYDD